MTEEHDPYDSGIHTEKSMCIRLALEAGLSREEAEEACCTIPDRPILEADAQNTENMSVDVSKVFPHLGADVKEKPKEKAADGLDIQKRAPEPIEICIQCRMVHPGEDLATATKTCSDMFNDPEIRHVFVEGDTRKMAEALHEWALWHDPEWAWYRDQERIKEELVNEEIARLKGDSLENRYASDRELRSTATKNIMLERDKLIKKIESDDRDAEVFTVGNLFGKTAKEIREMGGQKLDSRMTVGDLYGKGPDDIAKMNRQTDVDMERSKHYERRKPGGGE